MERLQALIRSMPVLKASRLLPRVRALIRSFPAPRPRAPPRRTLDLSFVTPQGYNPIGPNVVALEGFASSLKSSGLRNQLRSAPRGTVFVQATTRPLARDWAAENLYVTSAHTRIPHRKTQLIVVDEANACSGLGMLLRFASLWSIPVILVYDRLQALPVRGLCPPNPLYRWSYHRSNMNGPLAAVFRSRYPLLQIRSSGHHTFEVSASTRVPNPSCVSVPAPWEQYLATGQRTVSSCLACNSATCPHVRSRCPHGPSVNGIACSRDLCGNQSLLSTPHVPANRTGVSGSSTFSYGHTQGLTLPGHIFVNSFALRSPSLLLILLTRGFSSVSARYRILPHLLPNWHEDDRHQRDSARPNCTTAFHSLLCMPDPAPFVRTRDVPAIPAILLG
jgi:hypothetical protein